MNVSYKMKKKWFGFWQRYKLKIQLKIAAKLLLMSLGIWIIGSILTILSQWAYTDNFEGTPFQGKYLKYFWPVIIELVSGYDVDTSGLNLNALSNVISIIVIISGIVIFAIFTAQTVSMFLHLLQRIHYLPEKPVNFDFNRPVVIFGINHKLPKIIEELRKSPLAKEREIVIVNDNADQLNIENKKLYKDVWYLRGNQADRNTIEKVLGEKKTSAIILASSSSEKSITPYADSRAIETAMAIEGYREKTHTVLELVDEKNIPHLKHTKINEWISIFEYGIKLVSQATLQHGIGNVYHYLLGCETKNRKSNQIYFTNSELPRQFVETSYKKIRDTIIAELNIDITLIGFARYINAELSKKINLKPGGTDFIKQINPVSRICSCCGSNIDEADRIGRIQKKCSPCTEKAPQKNNKLENLWFFPIDTRLNREDKLIYLSRGPVDFNKLFGGKIKKGGS